MPERLVEPVEGRRHGGVDGDKIDDTSASFEAGPRLGPTRTGVKASNG